MNRLKSFEMVSLLTAVLFLFGTLCLAGGKANCDQMSAYIKHFTRHLHDIDFPTPGPLKKICNIAANIISKNETTITTTEAVITSASDSQGQTDNSTTTVKTTTDVVDYDDYKRASLPPQVVASLLG